MSATTSDRPLAAWFWNNSSWLFTCSIAALLWGVLYWTWDWPTSYRAERQLCDQAVDALVHSKNPIEIQRAGVIIHEIPCGIGRRLEPNK